MLQRNQNSSFLCLCLFLLNVPNLINPYYSLFVCLCLSVCLSVCLSLYVSLSPVNEFIVERVVELVLVVVADGELWRAPVFRSHLAEWEDPKNQK